MEVKEKSRRTPVAKVEWSKPITQPPEATFPERIDDATTAEQKPTDEPMCQIRLLGRFRETEATRSRMQEAKDKFTEGTGCHGRKGQTHQGPT